MKTHMSLCVVLCAFCVEAMAAKPINIDEAAVPPYELPELIRFADGTTVREARQWPARRREILGVLASEMYGQETAEAHRTAAIHIHDLSMLTGYCAGWSLK